MKQKMETNGSNIIESKIEYCQNRIEFLEILRKEKEPKMFTQKFIENSEIN